MGSDFGSPSGLAQSSGSVIGGRLEGFGSWLGGRQWALILTLLRVWRKVAAVL